MDKLEEHEKRIAALEGPLTVRGVRLPKRWVVTILTSLAISAKNSLPNLLDRINYFIEGGDYMDLVTMIRPDFVTIALFLWMLGAILKYRTDTDNNLIPVILFAVSFSLCASWGYAISEYTDAVRWVDALLICGLIHGLIVTAIATYGWDVANGIKKSKRRKR